MVALLQSDEEAFADMLAQKTNCEMLAEQKLLEGELQKAISRNETVLRMYEKLYEDNAMGKVSDEWFMQLSHKYEVERMELKQRIAELRRSLAELGSRQQGRDLFISAIRSFMRMDTLTAPLLRELVDHIDVFEIEGTGKNKTQRITIFYRFVGCIEQPDPDFQETYIADTRKGVAVRYLPNCATA